MTSRNPTHNDAKPDTTPAKDEKPDKPSEIKRELTDEEIAAIAGGGNVSEIVVTKPTDVATTKLS